MKPQVIDLQEAINYLTLFAGEQNLLAKDLKQRLERIHIEHEQTGIYW